MRRQSLLGLAVWGLVSCGGSDVFEPPFVVEERVGAEPRTGVWAVEDGPFPVRFYEGELGVAFWVVLEPDLLAYLEGAGATIDLDRAELRVPGVGVLPLTEPEATSPGAPWALRNLSFLHRSLESGERLEIVPGDDETLWPSGILSFGLGTADDLSPALTRVVLGGSDTLPVALATGEELPGGLGFTVSTEILVPSDRELSIESDAQRAALDAVRSVSSVPVVAQNLQGTFLEPGEVLTREEVLGALAPLLEDARIPFDYVGNGCQDRALVVAEHLRERGVFASMVFVYGDLAVIREEELLTWEFHAASGVVHRTVQGLTFGIFDPAFSTDLLSLDDWLSRFTDRPVSLEILPSFQWQPAMYYGFADPAWLDLSVEEAWKNLEYYRLTY